MESKRIVWFFTIVGSTVGGMIPNLWGASFLSFSSVILTALGGILGIWIGFKISN